MIDLLVRPIRFVVWLVAVVVWAVIGFLVWIPFLFRLTGNYLVTLLSSVLRSGHLERAEASLHRGITFYFDGFEKTLSILIPERTPDDRVPMSGPNFGQLFRLGFEIAYTAVFWVFVIFLVGGLPARSSGVCIPATRYCIVRESADIALIGVWQSEEGSSLNWRSLAFNRSGDITIEPRSQGGSAEGAERSFHSGRFYTNRGTLLIVVSEPSTSVFHLRYRVNARQLTLFTTGGSVAGTFVPVEPDEGRLRSLLNLGVARWSERLSGS